MEQRVVGTKRRATGALLIGGLDEAMASSTDFGWQELLVEAMSDPVYARRVIATLDGTSSGAPGSAPHRAARADRPRALSAVSSA